MDLSLTNTQTGQKEKFVPLQPNQVGLYVCGITPYDEPHLGHARCYVVFDVLRRTLEKSGYAVSHIQNFTDIDDKIIERAHQAKVDPLDWANKNIESFHHWMRQLNIKPAQHYPRVTQNIPLILSLIEKLEKKGLAYESDGTVYFEVRKFKDYGQLSKRKLDELEAGARVEVNENKRDPLDFALWKKSKPGEPSWNSPWGPGRPGWHIECSAMSMDALGPTFDIHGGGQDLIFPHHENEVAQSKGIQEGDFAKLWVHNGFVTVNKEKMSKSVGNFFTVKDILARYEPMVVRYFLLTQHYRSHLDFSDQELAAAQTTWKQRIGAAYQQAVEWKQGLEKSGVALNGLRLASVPVYDRFQKSLRDDLNTPAALACLHEVCTQIYAFEKQGLFKSDQAHREWAVPALLLEEMFDWLGLTPPVADSWSQEILGLVQQREKARQSKNWSKADEIRDALRTQGVLVEDSASGPRLKRL